MSSTLAAWSTLCIVTVTTADAPEMPDMSVGSTEDMLTADSVSTTTMSTVAGAPAGTSSVASPSRSMPLTAAPSVYTPGAAVAGMVMIASTSPAAASPSASVPRAVGIVSPLMAGVMVRSTVREAPTLRSATTMSPPRLMLAA